MNRESAIALLYEAFTRALSARDKARCIQLAREALDSESISIPELYEGVLAMSLYQIASNDKEQKISIWEEHVQSGIVRSVIEISYPYILKMLKKEGNEQLPVAVVFCQEEEYHELGARMATDFLTLLGFEAVFIGANTPAEDALAAVVALKPKLVCISVTSFFHLTKLQNLIQGMRALMVAGRVSQFSIVAGGYAVNNTPGVAAQLKPDYFASCYSDLVKIREAML